MLEKSAKRLANRLPDGSYNRVGDIIAKPVEHQDAAQPACHVIEPDPIKFVILPSGFIETSTRARAMNANNFTKGHCSAMAGLPLRIKEIDHEKFTKSFIW